MRPNCNCAAGRGTDPMLNLTRKTDYALVALAYLARQERDGAEHGSPASASVSAREIAERFTFPTPALMNVLKSLCKADLVKSSRGASGGYTLAAEAQNVSLLDVVEAIEGPLRLARCVESNDAADQACDIECVCPIRDPIQRLHSRLQDFLEQVTLAELIRDNDEKTLVTVGMQAVMAR